MHFHVDLKKETLDLKNGMLLTDSTIPVYVHEIKLFEKLMCSYSKTVDV